MESDEIISLLRKNQSELDRFGVKHLWLFGSSARGEQANDVDFLVSFESPPGLENFMGFKFFLEDLLGKPVDLLSRGRCSDRFYSRIESDLLNVA